MKKKMDRLDMLEKLTFIGEKNIDIFDLYIPNHYDEIYTLYTLLNRASLNYSKIEFMEPNEENNSFIFICKLSKKYFDILSKYLSDNDSIIKYVRNKPFKVLLKNNKDITYINFTKV